MDYLWRTLSAGLCLFLLHHHAGAAPAVRDEVVVHVQILEADTISKDVTIRAKQGVSTSTCFGTELTDMEPAPGQRRVTCDGLLFTFTAHELHDDVIHASFAVEYYKPVSRDNAAATRFEGFSFSARPAMKPGTPLVTGPSPYTLRLRANY